MKKADKKYWKIMVVIVILGIFVLLFFLVRYKGKRIWKQILQQNSRMSLRRWRLFRIRLIIMEQHTNTEKIS